MVCEVQVAVEFQTPSLQASRCFKGYMVRSVRHMLLLIFAEQLLTDEVLVSSLAKCELMGNGRSLMPVNSDCPDSPVPTPDALLIMRDDSCEIPATVLRERLAR